MEVSLEADMVIAVCATEQEYLGRFEQKGRVEKTGSDWSEWNEWNESVDSWDREKRQKKQVSRTKPPARDHQALRSQMQQK